MSVETDLKEAVVYLARQNKAILHRMEQLDSILQKAKTPVKGLDYFDGKDAADPEPIILNKLEAIIPELKKEAEVKFEGEIERIVRLSAQEAAKIVPVPKDGKDGKNAPDPSPIVETAVEKHSKRMMFAVEAKFSGMVETIVNKVIAMLPQPKIEIKKESPGAWTFAIARDKNGALLSIKATRD